MDGYSENRDDLIAAALSGDVAFLRTRIPVGRFMSGAAPEPELDDDFAFLEQRPDDEQGAAVDAIVDSRGFNLLDLICEVALAERARGVAATWLAPVTLDLIVHRGAAVGEQSLNLLYPQQGAQGYLGFARKVQRFRRTIGLFGLAAFGFADLGQSSLLRSQGWAIRRLYGMASIIYDDTLSANLDGSCRQLHPAFLELLHRDETGRSPVRRFAEHMASQHELMNSILDNHAHRFLMTLHKTPRFEVEVLRHADSQSMAQGGDAVPRFVQQTILLVDDQDDYRMRVAGRLVARGYRVLQASDGVAALSHFHQTDTVVDLVLTDFCMPEIDGFNLASRVREHNPRIPIVVHTTPPIHPDLRTEANRLGVNLIRKHDEALLLLTVREALNREGILSGQGS